MNGLLIIDKPTGITSRDAVNQVQCLLPKKTKLGHTGTLDPLASGVLVLCIGHATKFVEYVQEMTKTYRSRFQLGAKSDTDDADGTITLIENAIPPAIESIEKVFESMIGTIDQLPPSYSAARISGQRAYDLARKGKEVLLQPRKIRIDSIQIHRYEYPFLDVEVTCGKGTYIRSIARDLGNQLNCGALVQELRRTRIGNFTLDHPIRLDFDPKEIHHLMLPVHKAVEHLASLSLDEATLNRLRLGQFVPLTNDSRFSSGTEVSLFDQKDQLHGIGLVDEKGLLRPTKILM
jgi:tRNA pseudouridine55 synthase